MIELPNSVLDNIRAHAKEDFPRESCGLVILYKGKPLYIKCTNIAVNNNHFTLNPEDYANAEDMGEIIYIVHSHPGTPPLPSQADLLGCENSGIPWLIVNHPVGNIYTFEPKGYSLPLLGREFMYGVVDCYTLVRDYYSQELGIKLIDPYRADEWWLHGGNMYVDRYKEAGFYKVDSIEKHDVLLMQVSSPVPNHAAVYIGDNLIMQHQRGRLSSRDIYGGWLQKITTHILRHKDIKK